VEVKVKAVYLVVAAVLAALAVGLLVGHYAFGPEHKSSPLEALLTESPQPQNREAMNESAAQAHVRAAVPGLEAYNADHHAGYAGATLQHLRASYDAGILDVDIVQAKPLTYCIQSTVGSSTYHKAGPAGDILPGPCSVR